MRFAGAGDESSKGILDAIRTSGTLAVGIGGFFALLLAARRQRTIELDLKNKIDSLILQERIASDNMSHQERLADSSENDTRLRRATDNYVSGMDQLGSPLPHIRLGGLYALERTAQENPDLRQMVVNVICAFLRTPFIPHPNKVLKLGERRNIREIDDHEKEESAEKLARLAAQEILRDHSNPRDEVRYWGSLTLNLRSAYLVDFDLTGCTVNSMDCSGARFYGLSHFLNCTFHGFCSFYEAHFEDADFEDAKFVDFTYFNDSIFDDRANFKKVRFPKGDVAQFVDVKFYDECLFEGCVSVRPIDFSFSEFHDSVQLPDNVNLEYAQAKNKSIQQSLPRDWQLGEKINEQSSFFPIVKKKRA
ncbi:hypothetical protein AMETH_0574 [Amycolatopsis methanolica 239]|uniref:Pentapeptide repeat-containing protein n=1 Tax=Amycolatopsis methanolica 239 TaxID=1068978 RepID=A0A076MP14_AMYME|nr:hypothetical protein AMETH_0574 [Amycolatopsis methanolica 239]